MPALYCPHGDTEWVVAISCVAFPHYGEFLDLCKKKTEIQTHLLSIKPAQEFSIAAKQCIPVSI